MDVQGIIDADGSVYRTSFPGTDVAFEWRLLSLKEYKAFRGIRASGLIPAYVLSEMVFERCYLGDPLLISKDIPAGYTISLGDLIMYISGDCDSETLKQDIQQAAALHPADTTMEYMRAAILTAFPSYTLEDMDNWNRNQLLRHFVVAENILLRKNPEYERLDPSTIMTPEEYQQKHAKRQGINFTEENAGIRKAMGYWNNEAAESKFREEERAKKKSLSREQLRKIPTTR